MNKLTLNKELISLQKEYANFLKNILNDFNINDIDSIVDEISVFWYARRNLIELILDNISMEDEDIFVFTGATNVDIQDKELYPFITLGQYHIIDDAFTNLGQVLSRIPNQTFKENLTNTILNIAKENIEIIEKYGEFLFILPLSTLMNNSDDITIVSQGADNAFCSLFKKRIDNVEDYLNKFENIEDIINNLTDTAKEVIIFSDKDTKNDLLNNFINFKNSKDNPLAKDIDDKELFYRLLHGFITRAMSIILLSVKYKCVPYLRYKLIFQYFILLLDSYKQNNNLIDNSLEYKVIATYIMHYIFDKSKISNISLNDFNKKIQDNKLYTKITNDLSLLPQIKSGLFKQIENILTQHLNKSAY